MTFLLGRHATLGQAPPTYFRSTTAVRLPSLAIVQAITLPAVPPPSTMTSYFSGAFMWFISSERLVLRHAKDRVRLLRVNNDGAVFVQVRGSRQVVILIALVTFQRTEIDTIEITLASPKQDMRISSVRGGEIAQTEIRLAARLLIDRRAP